jgi:hypothetical protein
MPDIYEINVEEIAKQPSRQTDGQKDRRMNIIIIKEQLKQ